MRNRMRQGQTKTEKGHSSCSPDRMLAEPQHPRLQDRPDKGGLWWRNEPPHWEARRLKTRNRRVPGKVRRKQCQGWGWAGACGRHPWQGPQQGQSIRRLQHVPGEHRNKLKDKLFLTSCENELWEIMRIQTEQVREGQQEKGRALNVMSKRWVQMHEL